MRRCILVLGLAVAAAGAAGGGEISFPRHGVVTDTIVDALPSGLAVTADGDFLVTVQDKGDVAAGCKTHLLRSRDQGATWSGPEATFTSDDEAVGMGMSLGNLPDGTLVRLDIPMRHTDTSRGGVWKPRSSTLRLYRGVDGKEWEFVQELEGPEGAVQAPMNTVVELANGDWLLSCYRYPSIKTIPDAVYGSGFYRSRDRGRSWGAFEVAFRDEPDAEGKQRKYNESVFVVKPDGAVVALARIDSRPAMADNRMWKIVSRDHGATWSDPVETEIAGTYPAALRLANGKYLMACGDRAARVPRSVTLFVSDDGENWRKQGLPPYSRTKTPANTATGGMQSLVPVPGTENRAYLVFYAFDPKLVGHHQVYTDGCLVEVLP